MKQIVVLSAVPWHLRPVRIHQICSRLKSHRVLFVNPPPGLDMAREDVDGRTGGPDWKDEGEPVAKWLTVLTPPPAPAMTGIFRNFNKLAGRRLGRFARTRMADYGFEAPLLWCCSPYHLDTLRYIPHEAVLYDASYDAFRGGNRVNQALTDALEAEMCRAADTVLTPSAEKHRLLAPLNPRTCYLPNGVHFELFHKASEDLPFPDDLFNVPNPIFGHVGVVDASTDMTLIAAAARAHPEWNFVFLGPVLPDADLSAAEGLHNVRMLGFRPYERLPAYMSRFDVCLIAARDSSETASPLRLYEYLATGKPIVSTPHPAQALDYVDVLTVAAGPGEFTEACRKALLEHDAWKARQRVAYGRAASWDARLAELDRMMKEYGIF